MVEMGEEVGVGEVLEAAGIVGHLVLDSCEVRNFKVRLVFLSEVGSGLQEVCCG